MWIKLVIVVVIWLLPVACWFGASSGDRVFAAGVGGVVALVLSVFFVRQPMLRCGNCGAGTCYFVNYDRAVARLQGNWRRWFVCRSCGAVIDRVTGRPAEGAVQTPVVPPASSGDLGRAVSWLGVLLVLGAVLLGGVSLLVLSSGAGSPARAQQMLVWCGIAAGVGVVLSALGRVTRRRR